MEMIIALLAIYGLAFAIKEAEGPWGVMSLLRQKLFSNCFLGVFFFRLFDCYMCLGFWCGVGVYLLTGEPVKLNWGLLWGLAGGAASLILNGVLSRLHRQ